MSRPTPSPLLRQVARVRRRLMLQRLLDRLAWAWAVALLLAAVWFLAEPHLAHLATPALRWAVLGSLAGAATLVAVLLALLRGPSALDAALALDERFHLKERAITALTLSAAQAETPAGQAVRADAEARVAPLRVGERFPLRLRRTAGLVPAAGLVLALVALFYHPAPPAPPTEEAETLAEAPAVRQEIARTMRQLQKKAGARDADRPKSAELERLDGELEKMARKAPETRAEARQVVKELTDLEDQLRQREQELARRADALHERMKQIDRLSKKKDRDGPARGLSRALRDGDFAKAQDEAERLRKKIEAQDEAERLRRKLKDDKLGDEERQEAEERLQRLQDQQLSREEKEELGQQLEDLQDKLERLTRPKEEEERLRDLARKGEIDQEQLERELEELAKNDKELKGEKKDLEELAEQVGECKQCMKEGKDGEAAQKLGKAGAKMAKLGKAGEEGRALAAKRRQVRAARQAVSRALARSGNAPGAGRRPEAKEGETAAQDTRARAQPDRGRLQVVDHVPGEGFKGPRKPAEMAAEIRQAAQEAPEAIDRQRLPRSAGDMARGYFDKLRGPDKKKP